jgi:hypothetical protein
MAVSWAVIVLDDASIGGVLGSDALTTGLSHFACYDMFATANCR